MSKIITAALLSGCALAFVAAPITFDPSSASVSQAFAKHGADDAVDTNEDVRGGGGKRNDDTNLAKHGADDAADTNEDVRGGGGKRNDDTNLG